MNKKLNLVEILKDCPKGMELDCVAFNGVVTFDDIVNDSQYPIRIKIDDNYSEYLDKYGCFYDRSYCKCIIFPKGKTTWEGFQRPFVDGDVVTDIEGAVIIYKEITTCGYCGSFASLDHRNQFIPHYKSYLDYIRLSTEEEKQKLFKAIQDNGYRWNTETKTLEKLKKEKFDPKTLQPFDKVLVSCNDEWFCDFFSHYDDAVNKFNCTCTGGCPYDCCIPYNDDTKHLIGKSIEDAPEFYRYWEE
jgi:hypothetical protein